MLKTSDPHHHLNHHRRTQTRSAPVIKPDSKKVQCRRRIEELHEQRHLKRQFEL